MPPPSMGEGRSGGSKREKSPFGLLGNIAHPLPNPFSHFARAVPVPLRASPCRGGEPNGGCFGDGCRNGSDVLRRVCGWWRSCLWVCGLVYIQVERSGVCKWCLSLTRGVCCPHPSPPPRGEGADRRVFCGRYPTPTLFLALQANTCRTSREPFQSCCGLRPAGEGADRRSFIGAGAHAGLLCSRA